MSDENKSTSESTPNPDLTNIKAEMDRKLGNTESQLAELKSTNEQLLQQLQGITETQQDQLQKATQAKVAKESEDMSQLIYDNPQKYADIIQQRAEEKVMARVNASAAAQQKQSAVLSRLMTDYPELSDGNNPLTLKAVELHTAMPEDERNNPLSYIVAVKDAAADLEIRPRSKRSKEDLESFTMSSGSGTKERRKDEPTESAMFNIAEAFGMFRGQDSDGKPIDVEKVKERIKKRGERANWTKYQ